MGSTTVTCDVDSEFRVNGKKKKNCTWVVKKGTDSTRLVKMCEREDVRIECSSACGICCGDNADFKFKAEYGKIQNCAWIAKRPLRRIDKCKKN